MSEPVTGGPTEIRSTRGVMVARVRHLSDSEFEFSPALAIESATGTIYITPGQLSPLILALVEMMEEVI